MSESLTDKLIRKIGYSPPSTQDEGNEFPTLTGGVGGLVCQENICPLDPKEEKVG